MSAGCELQTGNGWLFDGESAGASTNAASGALWNEKRDWTGPLARLSLEALRALHHRAPQRLCSLPLAWGAAALAPEQMTERHRFARLARWRLSCQSLAHPLVPSPARRRRRGCPVERQGQSTHPPSRWGLRSEDQLPHLGARSPRLYRRFRSRIEGVALDPRATCRCAERVPLVAIRAEVHRYMRLPCRQRGRGAQLATHGRSCRIEGRCTYGLNVSRLRSMPRDHSPVQVTGCEDVSALRATLVTAHPYACAVFAQAVDASCGSLRGRER